MQSIDCFLSLLVLLYVITSTSKQRSYLKENENTKFLNVEVVNWNLKWWIECKSNETFTTYRGHRRYTIFKFIVAPIRIHLGRGEKAGILLVNDSKRPPHHLFNFYLAVCRVNWECFSNFRALKFILFLILSWLFPRGLDKTNLTLIKIKTVIISDHIVANTLVNLDVSLVSFSYWITAYKRPMFKKYDLVIWSNCHVMLKCITLFYFTLNFGFAKPVPVHIMFILYGID